MSVSRVQRSEAASAAAALAAAEAATGTAAALTTTTAARAALATGTTACGGRFAGEKTFALQLLARELAGATHRLGLLTGSFLGWLFEMAAELHLAENALALQFLLERLEGLINIVVANENLQAVVSSEEFWMVNAQKHRLRTVGPPMPAPVLCGLVSNGSTIGNQAHGNSARMMPKGRLSSR
jgi:hypothetical protein